MLGLLKMCYTCLEMNNKDLTEITKVDYDNLTYLNKLRTCISMDLGENDSKQICSMCIKQLRIAYQFREIVLLSQEILSKHKKDIISGTYVMESKLDDLRVEASNLLCEPDCIVVKEEQSNVNSYKKRVKILEDFQNDDQEFMEIVKNDDDDDDDSSDYYLADLKDDVNVHHRTTPTTQINKSNNNISDCLIDQIKSNVNMTVTEFRCSKCDMILEDPDMLQNHSCDIHYENENVEQTALENSKEGVVLKGKRGRPKNKLKPKPEVEYQCYHCSMIFNKRWKLQKHITRVHNDSKKYVCTYCNKAFKQSYHLREHLTSHTGERKYTCSFCFKSFQRISSMRRHIRSHEAAPGQKTKRTPFLCTVCGKSFPFSNGVQRHMRVHLGIKNHECSICLRRFTQSTHLHVHMRTHTGEKPYICDTCGDAFSLNASLQKHMLMHASKA